MDKKFYIVRGRDSGVFFGEIAERHGSEVKMTNARNIWYWDGAATLLQMAAEGVKKPGECKFTMTMAELEILDAVELLPCTPEAIKSISEVAEWKR